MLTDDNRVLFENYFQKNSDYYIRQMERFNERGKYSFSIAAFFLGIFWMAYRKMYLQIFIILGIIYAEAFVEQLLLDLNVISINTYVLIDNLSRVAWAIVIGSISNRLYISKSQRIISKILEENPNAENINNLLIQKGGTSWIAPSILLFGLGFIILLSL
jgi:hypothetical protein